jgi:uncharacterized membrane protein YdbT with pleckstrin-like domain
MPIADSLIANESIVFESKKHWMAPIRASLWAAALILGFAFIRWISPSGDNFFGTLGGLMDLIALGLLIVGIGWIVYNVIAWRTAEFAVTNTRVLREEGLVSKKSSTTLLTSLSDVRSNVGFVGGRLGYGDIELLTQSGGAGVDRFMTITHPMEFRNAVMTQKMADVEQQRRPMAAVEAAAPAAPVAPPPVPAPTSADDADTLKRLADLRDSGAITAEEYEAKKTEILARM